LVVNVDGGSATAVLAGGTRVGTTAAVATSTVTATVTAAVAATGTTTTTASATVRAFEASIDLEIDLLLLLGARLRSRFGLANKVGVLLLTLGESNSILEDVISTIVSLADLELGNNGILLLLLSEVFLESEGVVLLFRLALPARAALGLGLGVSGRGSPGFSRSISSGSTPSISGSGISAGVGPVVGTSFNGSICGSSLLDLELGVSVIATPGLVDLLVRIGFASLRVPVERTTTSSTRGATTTAAGAVSVTGLATVEFLRGISVLSDGSGRILGLRLSTTGIVLATAGSGTATAAGSGSTSSISSRSGGGLLLLYCRGGSWCIIIQDCERVFGGHRHVWRGPFLTCQ
jgi:hypothetical protein